MENVIVHPHTDLIKYVVRTPIITLTKDFGKTFYHNCLDVLIKHNCMFDDVGDVHEVIKEFSFYPYGVAFYDRAIKEKDILVLDPNISTNIFKAIIINIKAIDGIPEDFIDWEIITAITLSETYICLQQGLKR